MSAVTWIKKKKEYNKYGSLLWFFLSSVLFFFFFLSLTVFDLFVFCFFLLFDCLCICCVCVCDAISMYVSSQSRWTIIVLRVLLFFWLTILFCFFLWENSVFECYRKSERRMSTDNQKKKLINVWIHAKKKIINNLFLSKSRISFKNMEFFY